MKCVFMHGNAPSHSSKLTYEFFEHERFTEEKIIAIIESWYESNPK